MDLLRWSALVFFVWGHEPNNGCIGAHFEGGFNHFWSMLN